MAYNKQTDPEILKKINKYNVQAMEDFLLDLKAQKKSEGTIKQYRANLNVFFCWIYNNLDNCEVYKLKKKQLRNYILHLNDQGLSSNRVNSMKSAVSSFFTYLEDDDDYEEMEMNLMSKVKSVDRELVRDIVFLDTEQIDYVRNRLMEDKKYQICLLWDVLSETGIRHNEAYQIQKDWIVDDSMKTTKEVIGKRKKRFKVCIHKRTRESYKLYMEQRGEDDIPELWINSKGEPASYDALYYWIVECRKILAEREQKIIPFNVHSLRHYFIDGMVKGYHFLCKDMNKTFTLQQVQAMVSHSSSETTASYCSNNEEDVVDDAFGWK